MPKSRTRDRPYVSNLTPSIFVTIQRKNYSKGIDVDELVQRYSVICFKNGKFDEIENGSAHRRWKTSVMLVVVPCRKRCAFKTCNDGVVYFATFQIVIGEMLFTAHEVNVHRSRMHDFINLPFKSSINRLPGFSICR